MKDTATISTGEYLSLINSREELLELKNGNTLYIERDWVFSEGLIEKTRIISTNESVKRIGEKAQEIEINYKSTLSKLVEKEREYNDVVKKISEKKTGEFSFDLMDRIRFLFSGRIHFWIENNGAYGYDWNPLKK